MAHNLTVREDGSVEMFSAGNQPVWHKLGQRTESAVTSEAAIRMAQLDWLVEARPVDVVDPDGTRRIDTHQAIVRCDNQNVLGVVGSRYVALQNVEAFDWLDSVVGEQLAIYETAGSIHGGKVVWMMVRLPDDLRVEGTDDISHPYVLVCNSHDGSRALRVLNTTVRVVCNNTLTWALGHGEGTGLAIRHTASLKERIEEARRVLGIAVRQHNQKQEQMNLLVKRQLKPREVVRYFRTVWPDDPKAKERGRARHVRNRMLQNFEAEGERLPAIQGTAWAAFNAVSDYTDWQRPTRGKTDARRDSNRLASMWFGDSAAVKRRAWEEAVELAKS